MGHRQCRSGSPAAPISLIYTHTSGLVCECRQNSLKLLHRLVYCCGCFLQADGRHSSLDKQHGALRASNSVGGCNAVQGLFQGMR